MHKSPAPSSDPKRWEIVETALRRHGYRPAALIEAMHAVQQSYGYLEPSALRRLAQALGVPLSKVYGVATFYHLFTLEPPSRHTCVVCTGTSCHIKGAPAILEALENALGLQPGEAASRGFSLQVTRCTGTCALAPMVELDGEVLAYVKPEEVVARLQGWSRDA